MEIAKRQRYVPAQAMENVTATWLSVTDSFAVNIFFLREEAAQAAERARMVAEFRIRRKEAAANKARAQAQLQGGDMYPSNPVPRPLPAAPPPVMNRALPQNRNAEQVREPSTCCTDGDL